MYMYMVTFYFFVKIQVLQFDEIIAGKSLICGIDFVHVLTNCCLTQLYRHFLLICNAFSALSS